MLINNAKDNAGVSVVIIGLQNKNNSTKYLFIENIKKQVPYINAYLVSGNNIIVKRTNKQISNLPLMPKGNMPYDGGNLSLSEQEKEKLINDYPESTKFIKKLIGAEEFLDGKQRFCLWLSNKNLNDALKIEPIKTRIENVKNMSIRFQCFSSMGIILFV